MVLTSPGSGRMAAINRGARRVLKSVVIELDRQDTGAEIEYTGSLNDPRSALLQSGLFPAFRTRPFGRIPRSDSVPRAICVTAMDTRPLAGDPRPVIADDAAAFRSGLEVLRDLCAAPVYLCTAPDWPVGGVDGVTHATFAGPHPAGLPGTHIHHLAPVAADRQTWHIGWQDTLAIGRLFGERVLSFERLAALGGAAFARPRWLRTRLGVDLEALVAGEWQTTDTDTRKRRLLSGSPLCGRVAAGSERWLGRYHDQVCALDPPPAGRRLRWRRLFDGRFSFAGTFDRRTGGARGLPFTTDQNGRATALVPIDAFEKMIPMDVLAEPLLRALLIGDTDQAQALGCLELVEEDLALCSFICPGKNDYGAVLRVNLNRIEVEG
jgi:Na+-transporting NADH:ubiquinone oxidoreductase subunit A